MRWDWQMLETPQPPVTLTRADLTWDNFDQSCPDHDPEDRLLCTRAKHHDMPHVAETGGKQNEAGHIVAVWDDDRSTDDSVTREPSTAGLPQSPRRKRHTPQNLD